jgi:antitoxin component YwqK of YwqJK toxin-antitoxin module
MNRTKIPIIGMLMSMLFMQNLNASFCFLRPEKIDSLAQFEKYDFIALVKIIDDQDLKNETANNFTVIGLLTIEIIELFKGEMIDKLMEYSKYGNCDIGISKGDEWILFGEMRNGKMSVNATSRNIKYKNNDEVIDWRNQKGFYELKQLRKLYQHPVEVFDNETRKEFYSNGQIEIIENYCNGKLNGERTMWFPDGKLLGKQFYIDGLLNGKSQWFYPSGQIHDEEYYLKGMPYNVHKNYWDSNMMNDYTQKQREGLIEIILNGNDSTDLVLLNRVNLRTEFVYNAEGKIIISRYYSILGKLESEFFIETDRKHVTAIRYHNNGSIFSIQYSLNSENYGHFQSYDENGIPKEGWDYDENGEKIK